MRIILQVHTTPCLSYDSAYPHNLSFVVSLAYPNAKKTSPDGGVLINLKVLETNSPDFRSPQICFLNYKWAGISGFHAMEWLDFSPSYDTFSFIISSFCSLVYRGGGS